jgi:tripartite-type tricarboxylate transporter receptor subunit TctC
MGIHRLLRHGCVAALLPLALPAGVAHAAEAYPAKPIRWIIPTSAGSGADTVGRIVTNGIAQVTGQTIVAENRAGAAGNIAADLVAKAPKDGYTVLQTNFAHGVNASLYRKLNYDLLRDFATVTNLGASPALLVVHPSLPVKTARQLVDLAKARPGAINYASAGAGSPTFIGGELFRFVTSANMLHVPYRGGGEAINAMVSGETAVYFAPLASAMPHVRSGRLRPLAAMSDRRIALVPEVPTIAEAGFPGAESGFWHGSMVPTGTPVEVINALHAATVIALKRDDIAKRLSDVGYSVIGDPPAAFQAFVKAEVEKWRKVVQATGLTAD